MAIVMQTVVYALDKELGKILFRFKRKKIGIGKWNGPGGHLKEGELIDDCARRELSEESGLTPQNLEKCGIVYITYEDKDLEFEIHIYLTTRWRGKLLDDKDLKWFATDGENIPYDNNMWKSDKHILPRFLRGIKCLGRFHYRGEDELLQHKVIEVEKLPERFDHNIFDF